MIAIHNQGISKYIKVYQSNKRHVTRNPPPARDRGSLWSGRLAPLVAMELQTAGHLNRLIY